MDFSAISAKIRDHLGETASAVSVAFRPEAPPDVEHVSQTAAAGCAYWKAAADGETFYTIASDHYNCAIGAMTHGVQLPEERQSELSSTVSTFLDLNYIREDEVPNIPQLNGPFGVAVYAPLAQAPCDPDVVIIRGTVRQIMLASEAALAAGVPAGGATLGRPACAMIPATIQGGNVWTSLACIGNRVYTGLRDDELYFSLPGNQLDSFLAKLEVVANANHVLEGYHRARAKDLAVEPSRG
jgi:uncharacterized protein (DUF169 family)